MTGEEIRQRRQALDLTIEEAAVGAGISTTTWGRIERAACKAHKGTLQNIAAYLDRMERRKKA